MPKNKLKPVIRYSRYELAGYDNYRGATKYLCIPLTQASRKVMIEAIKNALLGPADHKDYNARLTILAEAALSALENLGEGKS